MRVSWWTQSQLSIYKNKLNEKRLIGNIRSRSNDKEWKHRRKKNVPNWKPKGNNAETSIKAAYQIQSNHYFNVRFMQLKCFCVHYYNDLSHISTNIRFDLFQMRKKNNIHTCRQVLHFAHFTKQDSMKIWGITESKINSNVWLQNNWIRLFNISETGQIGILNWFHYEAQ